MGCDPILPCRTALITGSKGVAKHLFSDMPTAATETSPVTVPKKTCRDTTIRKPQINGFPLMLVGYMRVSSESDRQITDLQRGGWRRDGRHRLTKLILGAINRWSQELAAIIERSLTQEVRVAEVGRHHGYREPRGASRRGGSRLDGCLASPQPARRV